MPNQRNRVQCCCCTRSRSRKCGSCASWRRSTAWTNNKSFITYFLVQTHHRHRQTPRQRQHWCNIKRRFRRRVHHAHLRTLHGLQIPSCSQICSQIRTPTPACLPHLRSLSCCLGQADRGLCDMCALWLGWVGVGVGVGDRVLSCASTAA